VTDDISGSISSPILSFTQHELAGLQREFQRPGFESAPHIAEAIAAPEHSADVMC
jgi:hypothetical protein